MMVKLVKLIFLFFAGKERFSLTGHKRVCGNTQWSFLC